MTFAPASGPLRPFRSLQAHRSDPVDQRDLGRLPEWNLSDLYASMDAPAYKADLDRAATEAADFQQTYKGKLQDLAEGAEASALLEQAVKRFEALDDVLGRIMSFASLVYVGDTADPVRTKFYGDAQERVTTISSDLLFFTLELNRLDDALIETAAVTAPLSHYRPWLDDIRKDRPFQLDDKIEQLFHEKSVTGRGAWNRLFDETITSLRFDVDGEKVTLEPVLNLLQDERAEKRESAAKALSKTLGENSRTFALITNTLAKDLEISNRWRGFADVADSRHLANRVEGEVVDALSSAVEDAYPRLSHRYYRMKARWFGKDKLDSWDRNAPLPHMPAITHPWTEARAIVLDAYRQFSPELSSIAQRFFDDRWIDAAVRPGKAPGAFAHPTVPSAHPYVLMNYQGRPRDVMTLAHELGHGVHQVLAAPNGALMAPTPLTLAETASVFGEMLTFKSLLAKAPTQEARFALLSMKVEDMLNTVVRQIAFYQFERALHEERRNGELTAVRIGELWMKVQAASLGEAIRLGPGYETFWAYVPHFVHSPFYVYAYAFGDCLVNSLYGVYQKAPDGFADRYLAMLSAGGTKHHSELLAPFGLDARDPAFWQIGLGVIEEMIAELEAGSPPRA
ncbi:M3 family oligoendopeptidase [Lichenihabitans psoromatis]|uniref:M3 family oligoendopeptidase n=1 Tax=Lichenihabitans psoromatis TaxID=2528642 RepID=UPI0010384F3C|nr:M3 family oligoendopeptidase [Lichenihabitans psoromatis]